MIYQFGVSWTLRIRDGANCRNVLNVSLDLGLAHPLRLRLRARRTSPAATFLRRRPRVATSSRSSSVAVVNYNDREAFKSELKTCVKTEEMVTPVTKIAEQIYTISRPTVDLHLVKKMDNKVCLSQQGSILQIIFVAIDSVLHCTVDMEA